METKHHQNPKSTEDTEQKKEKFIQILKQIKSATSSEKNKRYTNISVKQCIVGKRESGTQFLIDIDTLFDIYNNANIEDIQPSDLEDYINDKGPSRSPAVAILHEVEKHIK